MLDLQAKLAYFTLKVANARGLAGQVNVAHFFGLVDKILASFGDSVSQSWDWQISCQHPVYCKLFCGDCNVE